MTMVALEGQGVALAGASGAGKSDLALRLIDRGAVLVSDDYTELRVDHGQLFGSPPVTIAGKIEVRGIGIISMPHQSDIPLRLVVDLDQVPERMPAPESRTICGIAIASIRLKAHEASAPIKIELALKAILSPQE